MTKARPKPTRTDNQDPTADPEQLGLTLGGREGAPGSELNPVTIVAEEWGREEKQLVASVRGGLRAPSAQHREAVLRGLQRLAKRGSEWHFAGQIAGGLTAGQAQPALEQLVDEGVAEHAVRASGWRCLVYRLAATQPGEGAP